MRPLKLTMSAFGPYAGQVELELSRLGEQGLSLAGAVHEYTDPATGKEYLYFPIRRLPSE